MKFSIAGTGNVAHHFAHMLQRQGHVILQVYSRNEEVANSFVSKFGGQAIGDPGLFSLENDIVLLAVADDAISTVAGKIHRDLLLVHSSGTTAMNLLPQIHKGVIWPIQSLSKEKAADYSSMPFLVEASDEKTRDFILGIMGEISELVRYATTEVRAITHLSAVFANNFVNQMIAISDELLTSHGLELEILLPIIREEVEKISAMSPRDAQTGPARRGDMKTIEKHTTMLNDQPELQEIYRNITKRIFSQYHNHEL